jgi:hypothetical protein
MGRIINPESAGKERKELSRATALALQELMRQTEVNDLTRDLAAFVALALESIHQTIDASVVAWEKRGYWLKADRFRMEWSWSERLAGEMRSAILSEDWGRVAMIAVRVAEKIKDVKVPQRNRIGTPWIGAWRQLRGEF